VNAPAQGRLRLRRTDFGHDGNAFLDGGWWPQSQDLAGELPQLLADADSAGFHARRVLFNLDDGWMPPPRRMVVAGTPIKLSGYHHQPRGTITLLDDSGRGRLEILTVPVGADAAVGERMMSQAARDGDPGSGESILAAGTNTP
jgi:hypothetical protein